MPPQCNASLACLVGAGGGGGSAGRGDELHDPGGKQVSEGVSTVISNHPTPTPTSSLSSTSEKGRNEIRGLVLLPSPQSILKLPSPPSPHPPPTSWPFPSRRALRGHGGHPPPPQLAGEPPSSLLSARPLCQSGSWPLPSRTPPSLLFRAHPPGRFRVFEGKQLSVHPDPSPSEPLLQTTALPPTPRLPCPAPQGKHLPALPRPSRGADLPATPTPASPR